MRLRRKLRSALAPIGDYYRERNNMAREWGLPRQWVVCASCGEQDWVLPPHGLEPCPLVIQMTEQVGLKIDAERMASVRVGVGMEEVTREMRRLMGEEEAS
jgi:hypothetical protein